MNIRDFLTELAFYFPMERKGEDTLKLFEIYVDDILDEINKSKWNGYDCDFEQLLRSIRRGYQYKKFPSIAEIIPFIPDAMKPNRQESYSGREGETIKRIICGHEYEFTIVPNHWDNVKSISQLDEEIAQMKEGVNL